MDTNTAYLHLVKNPINIKDGEKWSDGQPPLSHLTTDPMLHSTEYTLHYQGTSSVFRQSGFLEARRSQSQILSESTLLDFGEKFLWGDLHR